MLGSRVTFALAANSSASVKVTIVYGVSSVELAAEACTILITTTTEEKEISGKLFVGRVSIGKSWF